MKKISWYVLIACIGSCVFSLVFAAGAVKTLQISDQTSTASPTLTLEECFRLALKKSETVAINREQIKEAEAHFLQSLGTLLPHVSFARTETMADTEGSASSKKRTYDQKFVFTQTLFSGFKEFAGISGSKSEIKQRTYETKRAEHLLFVDVADAFYLLLEIREDLKTLEKTQVAFQDRIAELNARVEIGKSRPSEVANTEVQLYTIEAEIESVRNQETVALDLLEYLIDRPVGTITDPGDVIVLKPESEYSKGAAVRPDVQAANFELDVNKKKAYIAKTGFFPSVNLESGYYTHKTSAPAYGEWDALLSINVPIFEGTETMGEVKAANAVARQSQLKYGRAIRLALQDIHDSYSRASSSLARSAILQKALQSADRNYTLQEQDYKLSLVNNLDVLSAISSLEDARRNFNSTFYESRRFYWQLRAAAGDMPTTE
jgi:outer membrane protein